MASGLGHARRCRIASLERHDLDRRRWAAAAWRPGGAGGVGARRLSRDVQLRRHARPGSASAAATLSAVSGLPWLPCPSAPRRPSPSASWRRWRSGLLALADLAQGARRSASKLCPSMTCTSKPKAASLPASTSADCCLRDVVRLALAVAVEDRADVGELVVDDEVERPPRSGPSRLSPSPMMQKIRLSMPRSRAARPRPAADAQPLAQRAGGGIEEREATAGFGWPSSTLSSSRRVVQVVELQLAGVLLALADHAAQVA